MSDTQQTQQEAGKVGKKFEQNLQRITSILNGSDLKLGTAPKTNIGGLVDVILEITAEDRAATKQRTKDGLRNLLQSFVNFKKEVEAKKKELEKLEEAKMKEFNENADKFFKTLDNEATNIDALAEAFAAASGVPAAESATVVAAVEVGNADPSAPIA